MRISKFILFSLLGVAINGRQPHKAQMAQMKSLLSAGQTEDVIYDTTTGLVDGDISTEGWSLDEVYTTEYAGYEEKVFIYTESSTEEYSEDCTEEEHDAYLFSAAESAFDDIVQEIFSDAKEKIVEKILYESK